MSAIQSLRSFDSNVARVEAAVATVVLLFMILVAVTQAILRTATGMQIELANQALQHFGWADPVLQKGTLWVAFLGASLATHSEKHIAIDVVQRLAPPRVRLSMRGFCFVVASVICVALAWVFRMSIANNGAYVPLDFSVMSADGSSVHVCSVTAARALEEGLERPSLFCGVRSVLGALGQPVSTVTNALELIVPVTLVVMSVRFMFKGVAALVEAIKPGTIPPDPNADPSAIKVH